MESKGYKLQDVSLSVTAWVRGRRLQLLKVKFLCVVSQLLKFTEHELTSPRRETNISSAPGLRSGNGAGKDKT